MVGVFSTHRSTPASIAPTRECEAYARAIAISGHDVVLVAIRVLDRRPPCGHRPRKCDRRRIRWRAAPDQPVGRLVDRIRETSAPLAGHEIPPRRSIRAATSDGDGWCRSCLRTATRSAQDGHREGREPASCRFGALRTRRQDVERRRDRAQSPAAVIRCGPSISASCHTASDHSRARATKLGRRLAA